jgi:hypothetical protein
MGLNQLQTSDVANGQRLRLEVELVNRAGLTDVDGIDVEVDLFPPTAGMLSADVDRNSGLTLAWLQVTSTMAAIPTLTSPSPPPTVSLPTGMASLMLGQAWPSIALVGRRHA